MTTSALVLKKLEDMGQLDNTIVVFTTDNGAEVITFPDGGVTPFKGRKAEALGRRLPRSDGRPLAGRHQARHGQEPDCSPSLDWVPTLVDIAGGAKGDGLKTQIVAGQYPGIVKTTLDGVNQTRLSRRQVGKVGARLLLLLLGRTAVRGADQELEDLLHDVAARAGRLDRCRYSLST